MFIEITIIMTPQTLFNVAQFQKNYGELIFDRDLTVPEFEAEKVDIR
jgi:hypothetical protein